MLQKEEILALTDLRHVLHSNPELSGKEHKTAQTISTFLKEQNPDSIAENIGGTGILATWDGKKEGPAILIRAELDALPIKENNRLAYTSTNQGISHKCGHDGHMTILCGLSYLLNRHGLEEGSVTLLFQPAEETGKGAKAVLNDNKFNELKFDHVFALHNIPGEELGKILCKEGAFCMASKGLKLKFEGNTAHASQPSTGKSPVESIVQLSHFINHSLGHIEFTSDTLATITHINIGEPTLGISPGTGELWTTIRAERNHDLDLLQELISADAQSLADKHQLDLSIEIDEEFRTTSNHQEDTEILIRASKNLDLNIQYMDKPNPWSEDFGLYLEKHNGTMFGLGSGIDCPDLHDPNYDFPDLLIEKGVSVFWCIIQETIKKAT